MLFFGVLMAILILIWPQCLLWTLSKSSRCLSPRPGGCHFVMSLSCKNLYDHSECHLVRVDFLV